MIELIVNEQREDIKILLMRIFKEEPGLIISQEDPFDLTKGLPSDAMILTKIGAQEFFPVHGDNLVEFAFKNNNRSVHIYNTVTINTEYNKPLKEFPRKGSPWVIVAPTFPAHPRFDNLGNLDIELDDRTITSVEQTYIITFKALEALDEIIFNKETKSLFFNIADFAIPSGFTESEKESELSMILLAYRRFKRVS